MHMCHTCMWMPENNFVRWSFHLHVMYVSILEDQSQWDEYIHGHIHIHGHINKHGHVHGHIHIFTAAESYLGAENPVFTLS